jgi:hypothetical protein
MISPESEALAYEALELRRPRLGGNDPSRHNLLSLLALVNWRAHDFAAAERLVWQASRSLHAPKNVEHSDLAQDFEYLSRNLPGAGAAEGGRGRGALSLGLAVRHTWTRFIQSSRSICWGLRTSSRTRGARMQPPRPMARPWLVKRKAFRQQPLAGRANALKQLALFQGNSCHRYSEACETMKEALDALPQLARARSSADAQHDVCLCQFARVRGTNRAGRVGGAGGRGSLPEDSGRQSPTAREQPEGLRRQSLASRVTFATARTRLEECCQRAAPDKWEPCRRARRHSFRSRGGHPAEW